jgi:hypothetical protein
MARKKGPFDAVQFTRESAERIAGVVRQAELTPPAASPLTFAKRFEERAPKQVRAATFSGSWPIGSTKVVTLKYAPTATVNAFNLSWPITLTAYSSEDCIVGREGTNWWLVVPKLEARTAILVTQTASQLICSGTATQSVVTDVSISGSLNTASCAITIGRTVTTTSVRVVSATATMVAISSSFTASFLRVRVP